MTLRDKELPVNSTLCLFDGCDARARNDAVFVGLNAADADRANDVAIRDDRFAAFDRQCAGQAEDRVPATLDGFFKDLGGPLELDGARAFGPPSAWNENPTTETCA